jgi:hypothetical protein
VARTESNKLPWEDTAEHAAATAPGDGGDAGQSPLDAQHAASEQASPLDERPELLVGAAFAGGFVLAQLLKFLGPDDD